MIAVTLLFVISTVNALPEGAPTTICNTLMPDHGVPPKSGNSPYEIMAIPQQDHILVTIKSPLDYPVEGLMLHARMPNGRIGGVFEPIRDDVHTITCENSGDTITHNKPVPKSSISVKWKPPPGYEGPIVFNSTLAQTYDTFWVGVKSQPFQIVSGGIVNFPTSFKTSTMRVSTSPHYTSQDETTRQVKQDSFYVGCDDTKKCFGSPDGCIVTQNCDAVAAITVTSDRYQYELKSAGAKWVGLGLSQDDKMGDDSVVECVSDGNSVKAYMSWTTPRPRLGVFRVPNNQEGITLVTHSLIDNALYCKILRDAKTTVNNTEFDLVNKQYFLVIAAGTRIRENSVARHDIASLATSSKSYLSDTGKVEGASKLLLRLHGAFMLAAWIGTASLGTFLARYYRKTWVGKTICGKDLWFAWHRFFMICTWALTSVAFILIFVELKAWSNESNPHAILGTIVTVLCFLQPIGAYFRPHPGTPKRPIFNWVHWFGGNAAHIIAIVTIFFAVKLNKAELPEWFDWVLVAFVAFHVIMHLVLSVLGCVSENSSNQRISSFPMKDMSGSGKISDHMVNVDAPYSSARKMLLGLYILVCGGFTTALIVVAVLAPIVT